MWDSWGGPGGGGGGRMMGVNGLDGGGGARQICARGPKVAQRQRIPDDGFLVARQKQTI